MKKTIKIISVTLFILFLIRDFALADNLSDARSLVEKSKTARISDAKYDYLLRARKLYLDEYEENPLSITILTELSKVCQLLGDRREAKIYILKAYNLHPEDPNLQKAMGDFHYSFSEYTTALEYYKLALSNGLLRDFETNMQTAKCYEKLADPENAELYYKIAYHVNSGSKKAAKKLNEYDSSHKIDNSEELDNKKYKYLFKSRPVPEKVKTEQDAQTIINELNSSYKSLED